MAKYASFSYPCRGWRLAAGADAGHNGGGVHAAGVSAGSPFDPGRFRNRETAGLMIYNLYGWHNLLFDPMHKPYPIAETADFVAVYKPPGLETIDPGGRPSLTSWVGSACRDERLAPAHRLDRDTSGLSLFARGPEAEEKLALLFRRRAVDKRYLAICLGVPKNRTGTINRNLSKWAGGHKPVTVVRNGGLEASTAYETLAASPRFENGRRASLLAFSPKQGRTHQIRVHAAAIGYPILGDDQYGDRPANRWAKATLGLERQALHCRRLAFEWRGGQVVLECPLPPDMRAAAKTAFGSEDCLVSDLDFIL